MLSLFNYYWLYFRARFIPQGILLLLLLFLLRVKGLLHKIFIVVFKSWVLFLRIFIIIVFKNCGFYHRLFIIIDFLLITQSYSINSLPLSLLVLRAETYYLIFYIFIFICLFPCVLKAGPYSTGVLAFYYYCCCYLLLLSLSSSSS